MRWIVFLAGGLLAPTAAIAATDYDCVLDHARSIHVDEQDGVTANPIRFPDDFGDSWEFTLRRDEREAEIVWRNSPMQLSGKSSLIPTSDASYAAFFVGRGPCTFTETHCGTTRHFAEQQDGTLKIQLHPIALTSFEDGRREPFVVYLSGSCSTKDDSQ